MLLSYNYLYDHPRYRSMTRDCRICSAWERRQDDPCHRIWSHRDSRVTLTPWATRADRIRSQRAHRYVSSDDMWDRAIILPTQCDERYRCRTGSMSHRPYTCYVWYSSDGIHTAPGKKRDSWEWIREEATDPEVAHDAPEAIRDTEARWRCRCSRDRISHEPESEIIEKDKFPCHHPSNRYNLGN